MSEQEKRGTTIIKAVIEVEDDAAPVIKMLHDSLTRTALLDYVRSNMRQGETAFDVARRMLVSEALKRTEHVQKDAARLLGVSNRVMNYHVGNLGLRPKDTDYTRERSDGHRKTQTRTS